MNYLDQMRRRNIIACVDALKEDLGLLLEDDTRDFANDTERTAAGLACDNEEAQWGGGDPGRWESYIRLSASRFAEKMPLAQEKTDEALRDAEEDEKFLQGIVQSVVLFFGIAII